MDRATALRPPWEAKNGMHLSAWAAMMATESDGVTKNCRPRIMLRSASPSAAAPKAGTAAPPGPTGRPVRSTPMALVRSLA
jgi:hypothetical protein